MPGMQLDLLEGARCAYQTVISSGKEQMSPGSTPIQITFLSVSGVGIQPGGNALVNDPVMTLSVERVLNSQNGRSGQEHSIVCLRLAPIMQTLLLLKAHNKGCLVGTQQPTLFFDRPYMRYQQRS